MNVEVFKEAQRAYEQGDYARALEGFGQCVHDADGLAPADVSKFYHLIGNCHVKSGDSLSAANAYTQALASSPEKRKPSLYVNLGTALLGTQDYEGALDAFTRALDYPIYPTPYKAYSGIGAAQLKLGNTAEAGSAYREAALDEANPAPGKALVNLGVCFMELGRPDDAIVSYEAALEFDLDAQALAQTQANLGQAYMSQGRVGRAIGAFEKATAQGVELSAIAQHDYELAVVLQQRIGSKVPGIFDTGFIGTADVLECDEKPEEVGEPSLEMTPSDSGHLPMYGEPGFDPFAPQTQAMQPVDSERDPAEAPQERQQADETAPAAASDADIHSSPTEVFTPVQEPPAQDAPEDTSFAARMPSGEFVLGDVHMPSPEDTDFFDITEAQMAENAKEGRREARRARGTGFKLAIAIVMLLIVLVAAACAAYVLGYGYPLQEDVVTDFIAAVQVDADTSSYWSDDVDDTSRESQEGLLSGLSSYSVEAVSRATSQTTVYVSGTLEEGGEVDYELVMSRDGISWSVEYIELYFASRQ